MILYYKELFSGLVNKNNNTICIKAKSLVKNLKSLVTPAAKFHCGFFTVIAVKGIL